MEPCYICMYAGLSNSSPGVNLFPVLCFQNLIVKDLELKICFQNLIVKEYNAGAKHLAMLLLKESLSQLFTVTAHFSLQYLPT